ncbi:MAG: RNA polymerase factor sigma-54 [Chlamydiales bacterium]|nr:RNA polymerase factor sigma-54 [Chlamydiales bacterium]
MGHMEQVTSQNVKQIQRLILSPQMQQALHLLQLPILELNTMVEEELMHNPLLERSEEEQSSVELKERRAKGSERQSDDLRSFIENTVAYEESLYDHLMNQARETFKGLAEREIAQWVIGNLDADGLLTSSLEEIAALGGFTIEELEPILKEIQTFDPAGVGARSRQEALLIQLHSLGKNDSLAFRIVEKHFDDVIHNRIPAIAKALCASAKEIRTTIAKEISRLDLHPGTNQSSGHYRQVIQNITPDLNILYSEGRFAIEINDENLPSIRLNHAYLDMLNDSSLPDETRSYIQEKIASGKWLMRNLHERNQTLYRIAEELIRSQTAFLADPKGELNPMTMKEVAEKLDLHESTIARAVVHKYVSCPRGIFPLRSFFTHAYITDGGENISSQTVKGLLREIIGGENKKRPLSDEAISSMIKERGIPCARRTIAKYRQELNIGNTAQRRIH